MSKTLYRAVLHLHAEVCQDGIGRIRLVGPEQAFAAQDIDVMAVLCTAFDGRALYRLQPTTDSSSRLSCRYVAPPDTGRQDQSLGDGSRQAVYRSPHRSHIS